MTATANPPQTRPTPGPGAADGAPDHGEVRAELVESGGAWTLTLHLDPPAARALRTQLSGHVVTDLDLGSVTASVLPNLVPGQPFAVERVALVVADGVADTAGTDQDSRPLPG